MTIGDALVSEFKEVNQYLAEMKQCKSGPALNVLFEKHMNALLQKMAIAKQVPLSAGTELLKLIRQTEFREAQST